MKWYFALNQASLERDRTYWERLVLAALVSCRANTDYEPHLLFDGNLHDPFIAGLSTFNVKLVPHRVSFYNALAEFGEGRGRYLEMASGAFLRTEIPQIETDPIILYTDCDVVFLSNERAPDPVLFSSAPEFDRADPAAFNTGVMVMNLPGLRRDYAAFKDFIINNQASFRTFDQDAYRIFYADRYDRLPNEWNWRPYWGENPDAKIIHFHGPKPAWARKLLDPRVTIESRELLPIYDWNPFGYERYVPKWEQMADEGARSMVRHQNDPHA